MLDYDKAELHAHINGTVPADAIRDVLRDELTELPDGFDVHRDLTLAAPCRNLVEYLQPYRALRRMPRKRENLQRLVDAVAASLRRQRVRFAELRSSVLYLRALQQIDATEALDRVLQSMRAAAATHDVRLGLMLTVTRGADTTTQLATLLDAYRDLGAPRDIVGLDLAGDEDTPYPDDLPRAFRDAKERHALRISIHAGETGSVDNIRDAITLFDADRIGHGTAASRDPALMAELARRDICIEACPISNRLTGALAAGAPHPIRDFHAHGVPFVICSDNPGLHGCELTDDHHAAIAEGIPLDVLRAQFAAAKRYTFLRDVA